MTPSRVREACLKLIDFLQGGEPAADLFSQDVCIDLSPPYWRVQACGLAEVLALHHLCIPQSRTIPRWRALTTAEGFVMELEARWSEGSDSWYCREVMLAALDAGRISRLTVYSTGNWDRARQCQHAEQVHLLLPELPAAPAPRSGFRADPTSLLRNALPAQHQGS